MVQNPLHIAIQGVKGSFHEEACQIYFKNKNIHYNYCDTFEQVFQHTKQHEEHGFIAIENSLAGSILPNYASIKQYDLHIIGETYMPISHQLMVYPGIQLNEIDEIWSHPMALRQCQAFINQNSTKKTVEKEDTAKSAAQIKENKLKHVAAIASKTAARIYDLDIIEPNIETFSNNFTRFLLISKEKEFSTASNKATLCFSVNHDIGSLSKALSCLAENRINLTKIQSFPEMGKTWEYFFYIDILFESEDVFQSAFNQLKKTVNELYFLGKYENNLMS